MKMLPSNSGGRGNNRASTSGGLFFPRLPPNKSLQRTWLSRAFQGTLFVCRRFGQSWSRRISRHAAELRSLGRLLRRNAVFLKKNNFL